MPDIVARGLAEKDEGRERRSCAQLDRLSTAQLGKVADRLGIVHSRMGRGGLLDPSAGTAVVGSARSSEGDEWVWGDCLVARATLSKNDTRHRWGEGDGRGKNLEKPPP